MRLKIFIILTPLFLAMELLISGCSDMEGASQSGEIPEDSEGGEDLSPPSSIEVTEHVALAPFRLGEDPDTDPAVRIALKRYLDLEAVAPDRDPILFLPGITQNHTMYDIHPDYSTAQAFALEGYDVWLVDPRGRGNSWKGIAEEAGDAACRTVTEKFFSEGCWWIDDYIHKDLPAAIGYVRKITGAEHVTLVGFSQGGLIGLSYLAYLGAVDRGEVPLVQSEEFYQIGSVSRFIGLAPAMAVGTVDFEAMAAGAYDPFPIQAFITWASQNLVDNRLLEVIAPNDTFLSFGDLLNDMVLKLLDLHLIDFDQDGDQGSLKDELLGTQIWYAPNFDSEVADITLRDVVDGATWGELRQYGYRADSSDPEPGFHSWPDSDFTQALGEGFERGFYYVGALETVNIPVLFIIGDRDGLVTPANAEWIYNHLQENNPANEIQILPEVGHVDLPVGIHSFSDVNQRIFEWLSTLSD